MNPTFWVKIKLQHLRILLIGLILAFITIGILLYWKNFWEISGLIFLLLAILTLGVFLIFSTKASYMNGLRDGYRDGKKDGQRA